MSCGVLDDVDEVLRIDLRLGADEQRSLPALVVRRERDELEDAVDVDVRKTRFEQTLGGCAADESLCARARVDPPGLDADDPADALR